MTLDEEIRLRRFVALMERELDANAHPETWPRVRLMLVEPVESKP